MCVLCLWGWSGSVSSQCSLNLRVWRSGSPPVGRTRCHPVMEESISMGPVSLTPKLHRGRSVTDVELTS